MSFSVGRLSSINIHRRDAEAQRRREKTHAAIAKKSPASEEAGYRSSVQASHRGPGIGAQRGDKFLQLEPRHGSVGAEFERHALCRNVKGQLQILLVGLRLTKRWK